MILEMRYFSNEIRLLECGLTAVETRKLRGDHVEVFKLVNYGSRGFDGVSPRVHWSSLYTSRNTRSRPLEP